MPQQGCCFFFCFGCLELDGIYLLQTNQCGGWKYKRDLQAKTLRTIQMSYQPKYVFPRSLNIWCIWLIVKLFVLFHLKCSSFVFWCWYDTINEAVDSRHYRQTSMFHLFFSRHLGLQVSNKQDIGYRVDSIRIFYGCPLLWRICLRDWSIVDDTFWGNFCIRWGLQNLYT